MCYLSGADTLFVHCSINTQRDRDRHTYRQKVLTDREMDIDKRFQQTYRQKIPTDRHTDRQKVATDNETYIRTR